MNFKRPILVYIYDRSIVTEFSLLNTLPNMYTCTCNVYALFILHLNISNETCHAKI